MTEADFERDIAIIGAGRIGLPWGAVLAADYGYSVTCIDIDEDRVQAVREGESPFAEPGLESAIRRGAADGTLRATTDTEIVRNHKYVAIAVNAPRNQMHRLLDTVQAYRGEFRDEQVIINRVTVPVDIVDEIRSTVEEAGADTTFTTFPERLAEGKAIEEIKTLPKVVGVDDERGAEAIRELLAPLDGEVRITDPRTAMFVKLIDNSYRDALFSIANQIAYTADQLDLDAHRAISLANHDYPRNDIPAPGTVGGKCLPKDPHFLTDEQVCDQPTTPDLFSSTRRTNASIPRYVVNELMRYRPRVAAVLGLSFKRGVSDTYNSPASTIADILSDQGVDVRRHDPNVPETESFGAAVSDADTILLAVNHEEFEGIEGKLNRQAPEGATVYDIWGMLDELKLDCQHVGFGIPER